MIPRTVYLMLAASFTALPYLIDAAESERGYFAFGGEFLLLLAPFILWVLWINVKDTISVLKNGDESADDKEAARSKFGISILDPDKKEAARNKSRMIEKFRRSANV
ncbi:MAG: hypothetical protein LBK29_02520 [Oscillospiraceae bacterium]|jgi:hypothetical protein|nr:hypothetical protein [Oscillospiraceae bacterium]